MKILTTSTSAQTLTFAPREYPSEVIMTLRDNSTNSTATYTSVTLTKTNDKASVSNIFNLVEGRFYDLKVFTSPGALWNTYNIFWQLAQVNWEDINDTIIYIDKIFCTDQIVNQLVGRNYTINNGEYTQATSYPDDDYIIIS